jgi:hypothetical protein
MGALRPNTRLNQCARVSSAPTPHNRHLHRYSGVCLPQTSRTRDLALGREFAKFSSGCGVANRLRRRHARRQLDWTPDRDSSAFLRRLAVKWPPVPLPGRTSPPHTAGRPGSPGCGAIEMQRTRHPPPPLPRPFAQLAVAGWARSSHLLLPPARCPLALLAARERPPRPPLPPPPPPRLRLPPAWPRRPCGATTLRTRRCASR